MNFTIMSAKEANEQTSKWIEDHTGEQIKAKIEKAISVGEYSIKYSFLNDIVESTYFSLLKEKGYHLVENGFRTYIISWGHIK